MQKQSIVLTPKRIATFRALQEIRRLTILIALEYKNVCELSVPTDPQPDPKQGQTKEGLEMLVRDYLQFLKTPWGLFPGYSGATHNYINGCRAPMERLLENITLYSNETLFSWPYEKNDATLKPSIRSQTKVHNDALQKESYKRYFEDNPGSAYGIQMVKTEFECITCPRAVSCPEELYRNDEEVMAEWQALQELAKNNYIMPTPRSTKSPKTPKAPKTSPKSLITLPLLATLPTTAPSDPTSPKSPMLPKLVSTPQTESLPSSPYNYGSFSQTTSPMQQLSTRTSPCSPHDQESSRLLPCSKTHTSDSNCSCKCSLM
jgi:hypothetical protein